MENGDDYRVDMSLVTALMMLPEALLRGNSKVIKDQKLALISLFQYANKSPNDLGRLGLLDLMRTEFSKCRKVLFQLIDGPLGNPVWSLLSHTDRQTSDKLLSDLDDYAKAIPKKKSLRSIMGGFLDLHPEYGDVAGEANALGVSVAEVKARRRAESKLFPVCGAQGMDVNRLGSIVSRLCLIQAAAIPLSKKEAIAQAKAKNPNIRAEDVPDYGEHIRRPDAFLYMLALKGLAGVCRVKKAVFEEMAAMHKQTGFTNFLPFAPLFQQWFASNPAYKSHTPSINQLASILGEYSGETSHFMGDITKLMNKGSRIEWKELGLTVGKLILKTEQIPKVSLGGEDSKLREYQTKTFTDPEVGTVYYGQDLGWYVVEDGLHGGGSIEMSQIRSSLESDKIRYLNFARKGESMVFHTPASRRRLNGWMRDQGKQQIVADILGAQVSEALNRLPSAHKIKEDPYTVIPFLTRELYLEKGAQSPESKLYISGTSKEELRRRTELVETRKLEREALQQKENEKNLRFKKLDRNTIEKKIEILLEQRDDDLELELWFAELIKRDLGINILDLLSMRGKTESTFAFDLNDKQLFGCENWAEAATHNWSEDSKTRPTMAVKEVSNVWACMSLIKASLNLKADDRPFSFKEVWDYHILQRFPLPPDERSLQGVLALLPIIYWVYFLDMPYRRSKHIHLLVPNMRISGYKDQSPTRVVNEVKTTQGRIKLRSLLGDHKLVPTFGSIEDFNPSRLLRDLCTHMGIPFNPDDVDSVFNIDSSTDGSKIFELRDALSLCIDQYRKELSRNSLIELSSFTAMVDTSVSKVKEVYTQCKDLLNDWYTRVTEPLIRIEIGPIGLVIKEDEDIQCSKAKVRPWYERLQPLRPIRGT